MVDIKSLLPELRKLVAALAEDLLARSTSGVSIDAGLRSAFEQIEKGGRTAQAFEVWRDDYLDQVAVAWVLACVFVRFMEDNALIDECWLAGEGDRRKLAEDTHELFFREHAHDTDREYFHHVFHEVGKIPAAKDLFAEGKTPLWAVAPSGDAAMHLLKFWREINAESGSLKRTFKVESGDTRFLGDLYQELSERAKKKFALLQTPVFVEEFILDRTLTPAIAEFGLDKVRMIDPTCGSGHFLLGGFARLFDLWSKPEYTTGNAEKDAQKALDGVWGVDINPFAVAIARFRLIVAAVHGCGINRLKQAPGWNIHLASGDSLLFGSKPSFGGERVGMDQQINLFEVPDIYAVEDRDTVKEILGQGYHAVVGNPPYITVKDKAQNEAYRRNFSQVCHRQYSLGVPFTQRFWELAIQHGEEKGGTGYIGMITTNSFMKREFGKKLIEDFFPHVDLTHVIDTSGAYIPGHGTPTVILFGRSRKPVVDTVRAVLGIKGEPSTPFDASQGLVWRSIGKNIDLINTQDEFTSTADISRPKFSQHPWSIGGGGANGVKESIQDGSDALLESISESIGFMCITKQDEIFSQPLSVLSRFHCEPDYIRRFGIGEEVRDWCNIDGDWVIFPYDERIQTVVEQSIPNIINFMWPYRTPLNDRKVFGGQNYKQVGKPWYEYGQIPADKLRSPLSIVYSAIASHNHFALDRGGKIFKQSAPIVKLPIDATDVDHLALLGLLNSSVICFWLKQVTQIKTQVTGMDSHEWQLRRDIDGAKVKAIPICDVKPLSLSRRLDQAARQIVDNSASKILDRWSKNDDLDSLIEEGKLKTNLLREQMIAIQEELDWHCYYLYGLLSEDICFVGEDVPGLYLGQRAFEIVMARHIANGELRTGWFERHGSTPITEVPDHWTAAYQQLVERRIKIIETNNEISIIEKPEYKRRWIPESWVDQERRALKNWLLSRLETSDYRKAINGNSELTTTAEMADVATADVDFRQVASRYRGRPDFDVSALVAELVEGESVPFLPILRYKPTGLRKRQVWERTWDLQRQQDAGKDVGDIPVPPKYTSADFLKSDFWRLRGKLDVPKERWISYPHCSTESDPSLVVGWAGMNHLEQATALTAYYDARKREGWDAKRLTPLLAGLDQLLPWIHQWHPEIDPEFGETAGQSFQTMLEHDAHELSLTLEDIRNWTPPEKVRKTPAARKKKTKVEEDE